MKCLDCGYDVCDDELDEHEGHKIIPGFFEEEVDEQSDEVKKGIEQKNR